MRKVTLLLTLFGTLLCGSTQAAETPEFNIVIKDHLFHPATIEVPANTRVKLIVDNQDATPEEFESHDFNREKVIMGNSKASIFVGPLEAGEYQFFGEFNEDTAQGKLVVLDNSH
jgi:hypothetical protein